MTHPDFFARERRSGVSWRLSEAKAKAGPTWREWALVIVVFAAAVGAVVREIVTQ